jgi:hypothetical protein
MESKRILTKISGVLESVPLPDERVTKGSDMGWTRPRWAFSARDTERESKIIKKQSGGKSDHKCDTSHKFIC